MNTRYFFIKIFILISILLLSACATTSMQQTNLRNDIHIETVSSSKGQVKNVRIYDTADSSLVKGTIKRKTSSRILNGHVHIDVLDRSGLTLESTIGEYRLRRNGSRVASTATFSEVLASRIPAQSRLLVQHHDQRHDHPENSATGRLRID